MEANRRIVAIVLMLLSSITIGASDTVQRLKAQPLGWWDKLKSYISYVPLARPVAYSFGGAKTVGRTMANFSSDSFVRFRGNLNIIQKEYYEKDLKKAVRQLRIELDALLTKEGIKLNQEVAKIYGLERAHTLLRFAQKLEAEILSYDTNMRKDLAKENTERKEYEDKNGKTAELKEDDYEVPVDFNGDNQEEGINEGVNSNYKGQKKISTKKQKIKDKDYQESILNSVIEQYKKSNSDANKTEEIRTDISAF